MGVQIADRLSRKIILRDLSGNIRNWRDDEHGGWIIRDYQVVNQARIDELAKIEEDRRKAATAEANAIQAPPEVIEQRQGNASTPSKMKELEDKVVGMESKLDAILLALKK